MAMYFTEQKGERMKRVAGALMLAGIFMVLTSLYIMAYGWKVTLLAWGAALIIILVIDIAVRLLFS